MTKKSAPKRPNITDKTFDAIIAHHAATLRGDKSVKRPNVSDATYNQTVAYYLATKWTKHPVANFVLSILAFFGLKVEGKKAFWVLWRDWRHEQNVKKTMWKHKVGYDEAESILLGGEGDDTTSKPGWFSGLKERITAFREARKDKVGANPPTPTDPDEDAKDAKFKRQLWWSVGLGGLAVVAVVAALVYGLMPHPALTATTTDNGSTTPTATLVSNTSTPTTDGSWADKLMTENHWKDGQYVTGDKVDPSKDKSTTGDGAFKLDGVRNSKDMVKFLKEGSASAKALEKCLVGATGATRAEVLDTKNWVVVQSLVPFKYPGNTSLHGDTVVVAGARDGAAGDIFLLFRSPHTNKATAVRGACGNAQVFIPTPTTPNTPPTTLTAKVGSQDVGANPNVAPWKQDGGQKHTVTKGDGSKEPNGLQKHPKEDAAKAAADAAAKAAADKAAHDAAVAAAKKVDDNQKHSGSTTPGAGW
jgi:hypothetical protein